MITSEKIQGYIVLTGIVEKEGSQFVSYCRELGTSSCDATIDEAFKNLWDAVDVHLKALEETGQLSQVLAEKHIRIDLWPPPDEPFIKIPMGKICTAYQIKVPVPVPA